ncbi:thiol-disulfide oxidoreductase DCC family protein [Virgibacillus kimchii]
MIIYYDGYCSICKGSKAFWKKVDWGKKLTYQSFRDLPSYPEAMEKSLHVSHKGKWFQGYHAILEITKQIPIMWPLLLFMYPVKWIGFGEKLYQYIARNRKIIPVDQCTNGTCRMNKS